MDKADFRRLQKLIEPCLTPEELDEFIQTNFGIELPWDTIDERSTSSSLKFMWEVNKFLLTNQGVNRHVMAVSRNGMKTLGCSLIQFISMVHFRRDGLHLAASLNQAHALIKYIDNYFKNPILKPYTNTDNVRQKRLIGLPPNDFTTRSHATLEVATATIKGVNSQRSSCLTFDEVDVTPREILSEAAFIADPALVTAPDGTTRKHNPLFIYLSSRKSNSGPIQDLIDEVEDPNPPPGKRKPRLHKWSHVDLMEKCPKEVHKPELGERKAFLHTETLETIWGEGDFEEIVPDTNRDDYKEISAFEGCRGCPAWIACQARSPNQKGTSPMLRTKEFIGDVLDNVKSASAIIAQSLNWKPENTGLAFKDFSFYRHVKKPRDFYKFITFGKEYNPDELDPLDLEAMLENPTQAQAHRLTPTQEILYEEMIENDWFVGAGVDFGFTDPAVCDVVGYHKEKKMCAVLKVEWKTGLANHLWADYIAKNIHNKFPLQLVGPDTADPSSPSYFGKHSIAAIEKKPAKIVTGVSFIRGLLWDPQNSRTNFAILDDSEWVRQPEKSDYPFGNAMLIDAMQHWSKAKDPLGRYIEDKFEDDKYTHSIDALRYFLNPFTRIREAKQKSIQFAPIDSPVEIMAGIRRGDPAAVEAARVREEAANQFKEYFSKEHGVNNVLAKPQLKEDEEKDKKSKKKRSSSSIKFSI